MKNSMKPLIILLLTLILFSCGKEDRLIPQYQARTLNQLTNSKPFTFSYDIDDTKIDEYGEKPGKFPIFGIFFKKIAKVLANASIDRDGVQLNLPGTTIDMSSLLKVDFKTVEFITLDYLDVIVRDSKSKDNLKFLDKIEILAKLNVPIDGLPVDENGFTRMLYYDRTEKGLGCDGKCLILKSEKVDWKKFLKDNPSLEIKPLITVNSVPDSTMKLAGSIKFSIKFNVGF